MATTHPGWIAAEHRCTLPRAFESVAAARHSLALTLKEWQMTCMKDPATLALSELITNAVLHGRGHVIRMRISRTLPGLLYLAVVDRAPHDLPRLHTPAALESGGRGLLLVDACSDRWGYDLLGGARPWGKRVWCEFKAEADSPAAAP
ncbi:ATP-binding protein [Streptomyces aureus]|uniref:ATP-binding protein n=1 Tax=Streptomyces aureus TaxID=193461 RepID=UPI0033E60D24